MATFQEFKEKALIGLFSLVIGMMWYDIKEMKSDIKTLIVENADTRSRLISLERQVYKTSAYKVPVPVDRLPNTYPYKSYAILNKEEDEHPSKDI